jgi:hypothetical protein
LQYNEGLNIAHTLANSDATWHGNASERTIFDTLIKGYVEIAEPLRACVVVHLHHELEAIDEMQLQLDPTQPRDIWISQKLQFVKDRTMAIVGYYKALMMHLPGQVMRKLIPVDTDANKRKNLSSLIPPKTQLGLDRLQQPVKKTAPAKRNLLNNFSRSLPSSGGLASASTPTNKKSTAANRRRRAAKAANRNTGATVPKKTAPVGSQSHQSTPTRVPAATTVGPPPPQGGGAKKKKPNNPQPGGGSQSKQQKQQGQRPPQQKPKNGKRR